MAVASAGKIPVHEEGGHSIKVRVHHGGHKCLWGGGLARICMLARSCCIAAMVVVWYLAKALQLDDYDDSCLCCIPVAYLALGRIPRLHGRCAAGTACKPPDEKEEKQESKGLQQEFSSIVDSREYASHFLSQLDTAAVHPTVVATDR